jgi:hypothetical protein
MTARVGGRSLAMSWAVGILCVAVIAALIWIAVPAAPMILDGLFSLLDSTISH